MSTSLCAARSFIECCAPGGKGYGLIGCESICAFAALQIERTQVMATQIRISIDSWLQRRADRRINHFEGTLSGRGFFD
jgi:hypothetical protein